MLFPIACHREKGDQVKASSKENIKERDETRVNTKQSGTKLSPVLIEVGVCVCALVLFDNQSQQEREQSLEWASGKNNSATKKCEREKTVTVLIWIGNEIPIYSLEKMQRFWDEIGRKKASKIVPREGVRRTQEIMENARQRQKMKRQKEREGEDANDWLWEWIWMNQSKRKRKFLPFYSFSLSLYDSVSRLTCSGTNKR